MAESVDALVSNTNEVTLVPVRLRLWVHRLLAKHQGPFSLRHSKHHTSMFEATGSIAVQLPLK